MAEAWFATHSGVEARSAGTQPEPVNLNAVAVMKEAGIDISNKGSNHIDEYLDNHFDFVITVCDNAGESCPEFPGGGQRVHQSFEDPAKFRGTEEEVLSKFRAIRDEIHQYVDGFVHRNE